MRLLVLQFLTEQNSAVSLSEIENSFEKIDRITLYRTIKIFEKNCIVHSIDDGTNAPKYALCQEGCECSPKDVHVHFHCTQCAETFCLMQTKIPMIQIPSHFRMQSMYMTVKGICANCKVK